MRRFIVDRIHAEEGRCLIRGAEAKHMVRVLRMAPGDRLTLMDQEGARYLARVEWIRSREVMVTLETALAAPLPSPLQITLCQALLRSTPMDYVIQKTTELGVSRISPFSCERTVVKLSSDAGENRLRHWKEVALGAAKQSDRERPPDILPPAGLKEVLARWGDVDALKIFLWEGERARDLKDLLEGSAPGPKAVGVVGPEGGFSGEETRIAEGAGFLPVSLGRRILRAETAAVTLAALLQYEWGDLSLKKMPKMS